VRTDVGEAEAGPSSGHSGRGLRIAFFVALVLSLGAGCAGAFALLAPSKPRPSQNARVTRMVEDHARAQWDDRVEVVRVEPTLERLGTDFPFEHEWRDYRYHAYFRIKGTDATFFASLPLSVVREEIPQWWAMSASLDATEVALLQAYSRETSVPAGDWKSDASWGFYAKRYPDTDVWIVTPAGLGNVFSAGFGEYVFERRKDGTFRLLQRP